MQLTCRTSYLTGQLPVHAEQPLLGGPGLPPWSCALNKARSPGTQEHTEAACQGVVCQSQRADGIISVLA